MLHFCLLLVSHTDVLNFNSQVGHWFGKGWVWVDPAGIWLNCSLPYPIDFKVAPEILECWFSPVDSKYLWNLLNVQFTCTADGVGNECCSYLLLVNCKKLIFLLPTKDMFPAWQMCMLFIHIMCMWMMFTIWCTICMCNTKKCYTTW